MDYQGSMFSGIDVSMSIRSDRVPENVRMANHNDYLHLYARRSNNELLRSALTRRLW